MADKKAKKRPAASSSKSKFGTPFGAVPVKKKG